MRMTRLPLEHPDLAMREDQEIEGTLGTIGIATEISARVLVDQTVAGMTVQESIMTEMPGLAVKGWLTGQMTEPAMTAPTTA